jgi:spermidine synthase
VATLRDKGNVSLYMDELSELSRFQTKYHNGVIYRHPQLGRVLTLNDEIQHVEVWAALYHEPLVHLPAAFIPRPRSALVIGGGSFYAAQELLKYESIERVLMLDLDMQLLEQVIQIYEHAKIASKDPRLTIKIGNAFKIIPKLNERFDLVVNDSVDLLRDRSKSVAAMTRLLRPGGICSDVVYRHIFDSLSVRKTVHMLKAKYHHALSLIFAAEYPGILHLLTLWSFSSKLSQQLSVSRNRDQLLWSKSPTANPCSYFDPRFLPFYLYLPPIVRDRIKEVLT